MARKDIDKARVRNGLAPRREPYWGTPIGRGLFLGFRKLDDGGTWIARQRDDDGDQKYKSLGRVDAVPYEDAVKAAHAWAKQVGDGVDTSEVQTVADACRAYVANRRRAKGDANADDAEGRFRRAVFGKKAVKLEKGGTLGDLKLAKIRTAHIEDWLGKLDVSNASRNRTLATLKAALNFAVKSRYIDAGRAIEWTQAEAYEVTTRRELYLDRKQRAALVAKVADDARPFVRALCLLPLRPGALAAAKVSDFDAKQAGLFIRAFDKKHSGRTIPLSRDAVELFKEQARRKTPGAPLIARADGSHWDRHSWKKPLRSAAIAAKLPEGTCAYTLRHSVITDMFVGGMDALTVLKMAGTSMDIIEKHYGHLLHDHAINAMDALAL